MTAGYTWEEIRAQLVKLAAYIPPCETLELCVFGGSTVLCWGMQDRLSNDVDVLQSLSSPRFDPVAYARGREKLGLSVQRAPFFGFLKAR